MKEFKRGKLGRPGEKNERYIYTFLNDTKIKW